MFSYRGLEPVEPEMPEAAVARAMSTHDIITLTARKIGGNKNLLTAIILGPNSEYATKTAEMNKALARFIRDHETSVKSGAASPDYSLMIIGPTFDASAGDYYVHVMKALQAFGYANPNIFMEICDYGVFLLELPRHCMSVKHWIPPADEVDAYCKKYGKRPTDFPRIKAKDGAAIWIGLRPGMVCAVDRVSETAGKAFVYKYCTQ